MCSLSNCEPQTHLDGIRKEGVWGSATELISLASMLQVSVFTFTKASSTCYSWYKYQPIQLDKLSFQHNPALKVLAKRFAKASYHIELLHYSECHYDRVVSASSFWSTDHTSCNYPALPWKHVLKLTITRNRVSIVWFTHDQPRPQEVGHARFLRNANVNHAYCDYAFCWLSRLISIHWVDYGKRDLKIVATSSEPYPVTSLL